jgi:hypothetical protein
VLELIDILARAGERYRRQALEGVLTVEKALRVSAFAGFSAAALYSVYSGLYSEAVVSSVASAVALVDVGRFREAVEYVQRAAKALYEAARDVFEQVKVMVQRLVELFVEAITRVLAWVDEHKAYLFLMAAVAAGVVALSVALNLWGLVEMEKLAYAAVGAPFVAGLADVGGKAAERFGALGERYERWWVDESLIDGVLKGERPYAAFLNLAGSRRDLPPPLVELRRSLARVRDEAERDAAVVAALVLYKVLVKNAGAYKEWAELYHWARRLVKDHEFTVKAEEVKRLHEAQRRLEEAAEQVRRELNAVLALYASHSRDLYEKLKPHLEVDLDTAEELAEARHGELSKYSDANMGTKAYAALLSIARGGIYGHAAMLLMGEGALADIVMSTPTTAHWKAKEIARGRGEAVDPSYSGRRGRSVGQPSWEDRDASALLRFLIGYGEADLKFRHVEKGDEKGCVKRGFQVFRVYDGVETFVGELWIGKSTARFKVSREELRHFVEEAKRTAPNLSGLDEAPQHLEWRATDVSTSEGRIVAATVHSWQLKWYFGLLGEPESFSSGASVTKEGIKLAVTAYWPREREDRILRESRWLESVLGRRVESWRELVDAIDWRWVLKKVEELVNELKPWIGSEGASDAEREGLAKRMLGELALLVHFAEAKRGMDGRRWREERVKRLSRAVEALSGGRIAGDYAERLAELIIYYAEGYKKQAKERIDKLAGELAGVPREEVWGIVEFVLGDMYCLARDCAGDAVVRKFVAPALELIMLDKAAGGGFNKEEALLRFGEMYATAIAGDGTVGPDVVKLVVGGELGGGAALLRIAALYLFNQLLPDELKFGMHTYAVEGIYRIAAYGENAARFKRLLAVAAPSAGGEYLSEKFDKFVEEIRVEVQFGNIRLTDKGHVAADLTISEVGITVKYNVYLSNTIELYFGSKDRSRAELAAHLLRLAGVSAEVKRKIDEEIWRVVATTDSLANGRKELRDAIAEIIMKAAKNGWVDKKKAERWLEKLERGRVLKEGWPKYNVRLDHHGALLVRFGSTNPVSIEREAQRFREMGLEEGKHFTVKMPEEGRGGYVLMLKEGLRRAAWLSVHGEGEQRELAAGLVNYILQRAEKAGKEVYEKVKEIVEEGMSRGSLTLKGLEKKVEVNGKEYVVKIIDGDSKLEERHGGRKLLKIWIIAEVDGVRSEYTITYGRYSRNKAVGYAYAKGDAPEVREADAERFAAVVKALTGREPGVYLRSDGRIMMECYEGHLEGFTRYAELADDIEKWLEETRGR